MIQAHRKQRRENVQMRANDPWCIRVCFGVLFFAQWHYNCSAWNTMYTLVSTRSRSTWVQTKGYILGAIGRSVFFASLLSFEAREAARGRGTVPFTAEVFHQSNRFIHAVDVFLFSKWSVSHVSLHFIDSAKRNGTEKNCTSHIQNCFWQESFHSCCLDCQFY